MQGYGDNPIKLPYVQAIPVHEIVHATGKQLAQARLLVIFITDDEIPYGARVLEGGPAKIKLAGVFKTLGTAREGGVFEVARTFGAKGRRIADQSLPAVRAENPLRIGVQEVLLTNQAMRGIDQVA